MTEVDPCEVYVRYLPRTCDEARLRAQFEKCGRIVRARVAKDRDTGECKGYGFMTFSNKTEARRCVREYNEHPRNYMDGKHAVITHATGSNPRGHGVPGGVGARGRPVDAGVGVLRREGGARSGAEGGEVPDPALTRARSRLLDSCYSRDTVV